MTPIANRPACEGCHAAQDRLNGVLYVDFSMAGLDDRLERGLFGDCEPVGDGVWELRIDTGAGYRVYYGRSKKQAVLLLCGGDKRTPESGHKASQGVLERS